MRLLEKEVKSILSSFRENLVDIPFQLFLFGSRVHDHKKGGDIDLLLLVEPKDKETVVDKKIKIKYRIFDFIEEQKIDITVATFAEMKSDLFLKSIATDLVLLGQEHRSPEGSSADPKVIT